MTQPDSKLAAQEARPVARASQRLRSAAAYDGIQAGLERLRTDARVQPARRCPVLLAAERPAPQGLVAGVRVLAETAELADAQQALDEAAGTAVEGA